MKKKSLPILLTAATLALTAVACGADTAAPSGQETPADDGSATGPENAETTGPEDTESGETTGPEGTESGETTGESADNTNDGSTPAPARTDAPSTAVSVTFKKTHDEIKADDGTVLLENDTTMPVVSIRGAEDIAAKINADIEEYYAGFSFGDDEAVEWAKSDYEARQANDDGWFHGYTQSVDVNVTRMDDSVLSLELVSSAYTGGAHGNYGSIGRNYDVRTGERINFEDLSEDISAFHATALDYMVNLAENPPYREMLFDSNKASLDSVLFQNDNWIFTQSGLSFFSDPYALGPYSSGEIYFLLPYEKAYEIGLKEDYRYTGNFMQERYYTSSYDPETMETLIDGKPEYSFDLNGDGTKEGIAFYGSFYDTETESRKFSLYIDGRDWGDVLQGQMDTSNGYYETTYALYDKDPSDGLTEIAVLFTEFYDDGSESDITGRTLYTYLFRYTAGQELEFAERLDSYITRPASP